MPKISMLTITLYLTSILASPTLTAQPPSTDLILLASLDSMKLYHSGDCVVLNVFAYQNGESCDLDTIIANLTDVYGGSTQTLTTTIVGKGRYIVQYNLTDNDTDRRFVVTGKLNGITKTIYVNIPFDPQTKVYIYIPDRNTTIVEPGAIVNFVVECYKGQHLTKPQNIQVVLAWENTETPLALLSQNGKYTGNFTVPPVNRTTTFALTANAIIDGKIETGTAMLYYLPYSVWYHQFRVTENSVSFDLGICDQDGKGVPNATIYLNYTTEYYGDRAMIYSKTNTRGIAHFYIAPQTLLTNSLYIYGVVKEKEKYVDFQFVIPLPLSQRVSTGLDALISDVKYQNGTLSVQGTLYYNSTPQRNFTGFYFLKNWAEIHGNFTTDTAGNFTLNITNINQNYVHPYYGVTLVFISALNASVETEKVVSFNTPIELWVDNALDLNITEFGFGKVIKLYLKTEKNFLTRMLYPPFACIYEGRINTTADFTQIWVPIVSSNYFTPINTKTMLCTFPLPDFCYMPGNLSIGAGYYESNTIYPHMTIKECAITPEIDLNLTVVIEGEDYITIKWEKYEGNDFVKYEILVKAENDTEFVSITNITDRNITTYRITEINGIPLKGNTTYRIILRIYFDNIYAENSVIGNTLPQIPGFTLSEMLPVFFLAAILLAYTLRNRKKV
ncbi:MAG: fibronectin type III domain-containing protein [Thermoplasmata archaeon]